MDNSRIDNKGRAQEILNDMKELDFPHVRSHVYGNEWINVGILYPQCNVNVLLTDGKNIGFGYRATNERYTHYRLTLLI